MKHIKTYDENESLSPKYKKNAKYKKNDYVKISGLNFGDIGNYGIIVNVDCAIAYEYNIRFFLNHSSHIRHMWFDENEIEKLTPEEIEEFKTILDQEKYNL